MSNGYFDFVESCSHFGYKAGLLKKCGSREKPKYRSRCPYDLRTLTRSNCLNELK